MTRVYVGSNIIDISEQLTNTASLFKEMSGESQPVIESRRCINKTILCQRSNDVDHVSEDVFNTLSGLVKTYLCHHSLDHEHEGHFPL